MLRLSKLKVTEVLYAKNLITSQIIKFSVNYIEF